MSEKNYDVIIIGAGIHGAGLAERLVKEGKKLLILEQYKEAGKGTSSKSSKLIHGGLRYLETAQFKLVWESLKARRRLLKEHPDLVHMSPFILPVYKHSKRSALWIFLGLCIYSVFSGVRFHRVPKSQWHTLNGLTLDGLQTVFCYYDAQTDDKQLTQTIIQQSLSSNCDVCYNTEMLKAEQSELGWKLTCSQNNDPLEFYAPTLINAAGPWINKVATRISPNVTQVDVDLIQGTHLVLDIPAQDNCYYLESSADGRGVFCLPWKGKTLLGTTEVLHTGEPESSQPSQEEINYLLSIYNRYFPERLITESNIVAAFSGLRVLPQSDNSSSKRSRETAIVSQRFSNDSNAQYIAIYGGKLTGFQIEAEKVAKLIKSSNRIGGTKQDSYQGSPS